MNIACFSVCNEDDDEVGCDDVSEAFGGRPAGRTADPPAGRLCIAAAMSAPPFIFICC